MKKSVVLLLVSFAAAPSLALAQEDARPPQAEEQSPVTVPEAPPTEENQPGVDDFAKTGEVGEVVGDYASEAGPAQDRNDPGLAIGQGAGLREEFPGTETAPGRNKPVDPPPPGGTAPVGEATP